MPLTIICVTGPGSTGKSGAVRKFTEKHLGYLKERGDVLGVFQMPRRGYAVGVTGSGDNLHFILKGQKFLTRYDGLRVMIVACRSDGITKQTVENFAKKSRASLHLIETVKLPIPLRTSAQKQLVRRINKLMPV